MVTPAKVVVSVALPSAVRVSSVAVRGRAIRDGASIGTIGVRVVMVVVSVRVVVVVSVGRAYSTRTRSYCGGGRFVALAHGGSGS